MLKTSIATTAIVLSLGLALPASAQERTADGQTAQCPAGQTCAEAPRSSWSIWNWVRGSATEPQAEPGQEPRRRSFSFVFGGQPAEAAKAPEVATKGPEPVVAETGAPPPVEAGTTRPLDPQVVVTDAGAPRPVDQTTGKPDGQVIETGSVGKLVTTSTRVPAKPDLSKASQRVRFYCPPGERR